MIQAIPEKMKQEIQFAIQEAQANCQTNGDHSSECAAAWNVVK